MSPSRRNYGGRGRGGIPHWLRQGQGNVPGQVGRAGRGQAVPQFSEEAARQAAKVVINDILKKEPPENTMGRLRAMGLNDKIAATVYSHTRDQVRLVTRRVVALLMAAGGLLVLIAAIVAAVQNWPGTDRPWHFPLTGSILAGVGVIVMGIGYMRWRRLIRT